MTPARAVLLALLVVAPACNKAGTPTTGAAAKAPGARTRVAIVTNCIDPFWARAELGARKAAREFDCDVEFRQPSEATAQMQMQIVGDLVRTRIDGLAVSVIRPDDQAKKLANVAAEVPFITMDNDAPGSNRLCYVGVDNYEAGKAVGRLVKQALPDGGTVALFIGTVSSANAKARVGGTLDELAGTKDAPTEPGSKLGKYTLDGIYLDDNEKEKAAQKANDVLQKLKGTPNLCCVGLYAYNPPTILSAAKAKGIAGQVKIVGFDESEGTLDGIAEGTILGTVVQNPFNYGFKSVETLVNIARGKDPKPADRVEPYRVVTKDGGPTETVNGAAVENVKVAAFAPALKAELESAAAGAAK